MILSPMEAMERVLLGEDVEYLDEDIWATFTEDHPIRLLWEHQVRAKQ